MKKETIITTAVIFLAVGFLAGYITDAQINWNARQKAAQTAATPAEMPPRRRRFRSRRWSDAAAGLAGRPSSH